MLWNHHHSLLPEHFVTPKEEAYDRQAVYHYSPIIPTAPTLPSVSMVLLILHIS